MKVHQLVVKQAFIIFALLMRQFFSLMFCTYHYYQLFINSAWYICISLSPLQDKQLLNNLIIIPNIIRAMLNISNGVKMIDKMSSFA